MILSNPELFKYYEKLGYSEEESFVLATLKYGNIGDEILSYVLRTYKEGDNFIKHAYNVMKDPKTEKIIKKERKKERKEPNSLGGTFVMCGATKKAKTVSRGNSASICYSKCAAPMMEAECCMAPTPMPFAMPSIDDNFEHLTRTDSYEKIEPNRFLNVTTNPTSTFRTTYNTASMTNVINNLKKGHEVTTSMVRTEELLNYMDYNLNMPEENKKFNVTSEIADSDNGNKLLFLGIQGTKEIPAEQNIVLLLDVSGSMSVKSLETLMILATLLKKIEIGSTISLVTYSSTDHVIFSGKTLNKETLPEIFHDIFKLNIDGGTYGSAGIDMAYEIAQENYKKDGINRVIIITDGDLNFGITRNDDLEKFISEKKTTGVFFSAIGTGTYNLMDDKLETLAKNGNGNYFVVNSIEDANKCINQRFESLVYPIAIDVKAQVEFNPQKVKEYKLVGYENRQLSHEDFTNDAVIAEPFGSGSYAIAMYEIVPADGEQINLYKYQRRVENESEDIATIKVRYKNIGETESREEEFIINNETMNETTLNAQLAKEVYEIAEILRGTKKGNYDKARINLLALTNNI